MEPANLLRLVEKSENVFSESKKRRLSKALMEAKAGSCSIDTSIMVNLGEYDADDRSGYRKLDLGKLYNAILFLCKEGVLKTKLNKLLFYADFGHFKEYALSITGARYAHISFGPAPDNYAVYVGALSSEKAIEFIEETYPNGYVGEIIKAAREPNLNLFSASELRVLASVKERFNDFSASQITELSHREVAYRETANGEIISYRYASQLNL